MFRLSFGVGAGTQTIVLSSVFPLLPLHIQLHETERDKLEHKLVHQLGRYSFVRVC